MLDRRRWRLEWFATKLTAARPRPTLRNGVTDLAKAAFIALLTGWMSGGTLEKLDSPKKLQNFHFEAFNP